MSKEDPININAVFYTKPIKNSSSAKIRCAGHKKVGEKINDEPLICNKDTQKEDHAEKYVYDLSETLYLRFYRALYTDKYLMTNKTVPVLYCSLVYHDNFWGGLLMNICIEFTIKSEVNNEKQLVDSKIDGNYAIVIRINDDTKQKPKTIDIEEYFTDDMMIDTIKSLAETSEMQDIIKQILEKRRLERVEKYGSFDDIEIPKPKYNFKDLVNKYEKTGELKLD